LYIFYTIDDNEKKGRKEGRKKERRKKRSKAVAAVWMTISFFFANKL